jgi:Mrp family chromosome partitioning ATPase
MVERLREAIEKARQARQAGAGQPGVPAPALPPQGGPATPPGIPPAVGATAVAMQAWDTLPLVEPVAEILVRSRIVSADRTNPAYLPFDVLRTRLMKIARDRGWRRIAVTSPTKGCGKSFVTLNLSFALSRGAGPRVMVFDLDMRAPSLAQSLGVDPGVGIAAFLGGRNTWEEASFRIAPRLAIIPSARPVANSAELLLSPLATEAINTALARLDPALVIFDLPPLIGCDDALAFMPNVDAVLIVTRAGLTTPDDLHTSERLLAGGPEILGVVLNGAEDEDVDSYSAVYATAEEA